MDQIESRFGTILKREALLTVARDYKTHALILYSKDPFPGYYCSEDNPSDSSCKEQSIYLPVYSGSLPAEDLVCRMCLEAKAKFQISSCPARFSLGGKIVKGIRLKNIEADIVNSVVEFFEAAGLQFYPEKKISTFLSHVYLKAFFDVKQISDQIFQNTLNQDLYYMVIPEPVDWSVFERLFTFQKFRSKFKNYDAALGFWYTQPTFTDFIRIYGKNLGADKLLDIRSEFLRNIKAYKESKIMI
ncbi:MAG: hypothetical protein KAH17_09040 [Bacteroidales bacterium]|nr:hypothetical protein [Bacteroidales bacterium]